MYNCIQLQMLERVMGIEPTYPAWKAGVLPLNYTRIWAVLPTIQLIEYTILCGICQVKFHGNKKYSYVVKNGPDRVCFS